ncbi:MAG: hypothetical protein ACO23H_14855, partial [Alphaproteobacteria bacterium]
TSQAKRLQALSGLAEQVGDIAFEVGGRIQKRKAIEDASAEALAAAEEGRSPEIKEGLLSAISIYDQSFNQTVENAYINEVTSDIRSAVDRMNVESDGDYEKFKTNSEAYFYGTEENKGLLPSVDERFQPMLRSIYDEAFERNGVRVAELGRKRARAIAVDTTTNNIDNKLLQISTESQEGSVAHAEQLGIEAVSAAQALADAGDVKPSYVEGVKKSVEQSLATGAIMREVRQSMDANDFGTAYGLIVDAERPEQLEASEWDAWKLATGQLVTRQKSLFDASTKAADDALKEQVSQAATAVSLGIQVDPGEMKELATAVAGTEYEDDFQLVEEAGTFALMSASQRSAVLTQIDAVGFEEVDRAEMLIKAQNGINTQLNKDPMRFAIKQGIVSDAPLDMSDPQSWIDRVAEAKKASIHYGRDIPAMTDAEADAFSDSLEEMTVAEKMSMAQSLNEDPAVWNTISKVGDPLFAMIGATNDMTVQKTALKGQEMVAQDQAKLPSFQNYIGVADDYLGPVGEVYQSENRGLVIQAALNHYAKSNPDPSIFDKGAFEDSLAAITGGIGTFNKGKYQLPRDVTEDQFEKMLDRVNEDWLETYGGIGMMTVNQAIKQVKNARVVSVPNNKSEYNLVTGDGVLMVNKNGNAFTFKYDESVVTQTMPPRSRRSTRPM